MKPLPMGTHPALPASVAARPTRTREVHLFLPSLAMGGAETNLVRLAGELGRHGLVPTLVVASAAGPLRDAVPDDVEFVDLAAHRARSALGPLAAHLRRRRPGLLLSSVEHASILALTARTLSGQSTAVVVRVATDIVGGGVGRTTGRAVRRLYPHANGLIVNAQGAAADLARYLRVRPERIGVLPNLAVRDPTMDPPAPAPHPWLEQDGPPVVVFAGRLDPVKNPLLLLEAFARVLGHRSARLLLLGEGPLRRELLATAARLGIGGRVDLPGVVADPRAWLRRARVFCLPSDREAMPNALIEAMAAGTGVVATASGHGPRELLADGRYGRLVAPGDVEALAAALTAAIDDPRPAPAAAWQPYTVAAAGAAYAGYLHAVLATC